MPVVPLPPAAPHPDGRRIITFGTFDLFHLGHVNVLRRAKALGDWLIVGVSSDELNARKKGRRPYFSIDERTAILAALGRVALVRGLGGSRRRRVPVAECRLCWLWWGGAWGPRVGEVAHGGLTFPEGVVYLCACACARVFF